MEDEELLKGGVNLVRRVGSTVVRPAGPHTPTVHRLLRHLRHRGFDRAPEVLDLDAGTETLSFLSGTVTNYPLTEPFKTDRVLVSAAALLRRYHDATTGFVFGPRDRWFNPPREPTEVICHGDYAPYNCVVVDDEVVGVFDFDTIHPGPRTWDVGYGAYRWVPLTDPDSSGELGEQARRLRLFCDAYGAVDRTAVLESAAIRLQALVEMMHDLASKGDQAFTRHIDDGHDQLYLDDIGYINGNAARLAQP